MSKVTVLVAVYNATRFLPKCLDSLLCQSMSDLQVICIDDGSTDDSLVLLQTYASRDARIQIISLPENHGQAFARNQGLKEAKGEYVCFLDADDWFSPDAIERAVEVFEHEADTDCVLFNVEYCYPDRVETYPMPDFDVLTGKEAFRLSLDWQIHGVYMVRTKIHQRFPYDDTCKSYSDDNTTRLHYLASRSVRRCEGTYHYLQHSGSVTHAIGVGRFDFLKANESMKRQLVALQVSDDILNQWETTRQLVLVDLYMFYFCHGKELPKDDAAYGLKEMKRIWGNIERSRLDHRLTGKFGYRPMPSWWLFRLQEWLYFTMRGLLKKNK